MGKKKMCIEGDYLFFGHLLILEGVPKRVSRNFDRFTDGKKKMDSGDCQGTG